MRYKEYNTNSVLEKCIPIFWEKGFRGTSIQEIVEITGVNRFSLYHEFQNKEGILYNALKLYQKRYGKSKFEILKKKGNLAAVLQEFYVSFLQGKEKHQGCFYIHIGTELADEDPKIKELIREYLSSLESNLIERLLMEDDTKNNPDFYARHLVGLFCTSMSFCLIHSEKQKQHHIANGIKVILNKKFNYATSS
ncbi:MAG: TetR/AcrR family transcriptional regulator [Flavobacteriaceae bacterium]|nr:TetR/AcrR family transcriptional regulator [Flavobacteriaceae bacterium]